MYIYTFIFFTKKCVWVCAGVSSQSLLFLTTSKKQKTKKNEMAEQQQGQSIIDVLPEDIFVILLSRNGLHPSLGSTCKKMRQLSLSEKCIGSVCVTINYKNKKADPAFLLYRQAYRLAIRRELRTPQQHNYKILGDYTWPYLTIVISECVCFVDYVNQNDLFPAIYAPRLTQLYMPFSPNVTSFLLQTHHYVRKRLPLFVPNIECWLNNQDRLKIIVPESQKGLKIKTCHFNIHYSRAFNFDSDMKDIISKYDPIKFIEYSEIGCYLFRYIDTRLLHYLSQITEKYIRIMPPILENDEDANIGLILNQIKMLYDIYYANPNSTKEYVPIKYEIRFYQLVKRDKLYKQISNMYPKISLSQTTYYPNTYSIIYGINSFYLLFQYPPT